MLRRAFLAGLAALTVVPLVGLLRWRAEPKYKVTLRRISVLGPGPHPDIVGLREIGNNLFVYMENGSVYAIDKNTLVFQRKK